MVDGRCGRAKIDDVGVTKGRENVEGEKKELTTYDVDGGPADSAPLGCSYKTPLPPRGRAVKRVQRGNQ